MTKTVTYLSTGLGLGGAEIQLANLAVGFRKRGWNVQVISMLPLERLAQKLDSEGVAVSTLNMRPRTPSPLAIADLARMLKEFGTEVLHSHMVKANILGRLGGWMARVPVQVSTAHNTVEGGEWVKWAYRLTDSLADVTTNVSQRAVDRYIEIGAVPADRIRLVRNGLDVSSFRPDTEARARFRDNLQLKDEFVWLAVGRLAPGKDYPNMIRAFASLPAGEQLPRLLIAGKGPLEAALREQIESTGLTETILMLGERDDVPAIMNAADAYIMSSAWEGAPIVLLEAAASRLPIVATDVGGNRELIEDGRTGLIVPPHDSNALADAMERIMDSSADERAAMGRAAREHTENHFDMETILDQWEHLYLELLEKNR